MQEKNELREEKASLEADIENLNVQYQQRVRVMFPWASMEPSVVMAPSYTYSLPVLLTPGPIPMQPYHFYGNPAPGAVPSPCSTFIPFSTTTSNFPVQVSSSQHGSSSHVSSNKKPKNKSAGERKTSLDRSDGSTDVVKDLELKMPGSSANQDLGVGEKRKKQTQEKIVLNENAQNLLSRGPASASNKKCKQHKVEDKA